MQKLKISKVIVVEGKYDKIKLSSIVEGTVVTLDGFGIFKKHEKLALIRGLSAKTPIILLTDSDGAGKLIRSHLTSAIPKDRLIQLYIPKIEGKEKRKSAPSAEGTLGVEGMEQKLLYDLLAPFEDSERVKRGCENPLSKADLYRDGLAGRDNSASMRDKLAKRLALPTGMTPNALLSALKILITYEEYEKLIKELYE